MQQTQITVGITAYREGELLRNAWQSILNQTIQDWKAILILDGGADSLTQKIFEEINDTRLRKIQLSQNIGPYPARNLAIENCDTDVYCFLDGDDTFPNYTLELVVNAFSDSKIDYFCGKVKLLWPDDRSEIIDTPPLDAVKIVLAVHYPPIVVAFRKKVWQELGGYATELSRGKADFDFILGLIEQGYQYHLSDKVVYQYLQRSKSVQSSYHCELGCKHEILVKRHPTLFSNSDLKNKFLSLGYRFSAWACFKEKRMQDAAINAKKYVDLSGIRAVWPLHLAQYLPCIVIQALVYFRHSLGKLIRLYRRHSHEI